LIATRFESLAALTCVFGFTLSAALGASLECSKINAAYDELFTDSGRRLQETAAEGMAMPEQQRNVIRPKICAISGEIVGYYKLMQVLANDCSKQGEAMGQLDELKEQLGIAEEELRKHCGVQRR
jgi:hypothetical protein